jgi:hypothetical protein
MAHGTTMAGACSRERNQGQGGGASAMTSSLTPPLKVSSTSNIAMPDQASNTWIFEEQNTSKASGQGASGQRIKDNAQKHCKQQTFQGRRHSPAKKEGSAKLERGHGLCHAFFKLVSTLILSFQPRQPTIDPGQVAILNKPYSFSCIWNICLSWCSILLLGSTSQIFSLDIFPALLTISASPVWQNE